MACYTLCSAITPTSTLTLTLTLTLTSDPDPDQATEEEAERGLQAERAEKRALCQERDALKEQARAAEEGPHLKPKPYALSPKP